MYRNSQKKESSCLLSNRFWLLYPEPFELQKIYILLPASVFKELSAKKRIFTIRWFFNKKSAIEKNPPFWKIQKSFFIESYFRNHIYPLIIGHDIIDHDHIIDIRIQFILQQIQSVARCRLLILRKMKLKCFCFSKFINNLAVKS